MPQTSRAIQPTSQDRSETLLIPTEARPTSRKSSAAWTIHLEGEPQSNDLPVFCRRERRVWVWRRAWLTDLQSGPPPLSAAASGDCASVTPSMGRLSNKQTWGSRRGARWAVPSPSSLRKACYQGRWQKQDTPNATPQQAATDGAPCHHHRASGRKTEPRTRAATAQKEHSCVHSR